MINYTGMQNMNYLYENLNALYFPHPYLISPSYFSNQLSFKPNNEAETPFL